MGQTSDQRDVAEKDVTWSTLRCILHPNKNLRILDLCTHAQGLPVQNGETNYDAGDRLAEVRRSSIASFTTHVNVLTCLQEHICHLQLYG